MGCVRYVKGTCLIGGAVHFEQRSHGHRVFETDCAMESWEDSEKGSAAASHPPSDNRQQAGRDRQGRMDGAGL